MVLWGECVDTCIPDVSKKKARKKEKKEKKDNPSSAWFNSMVLYFIKNVDMRYIGTPKQALLHRLCEARENTSTGPGM